MEVSDRRYGLPSHVREGVARVDGRQFILALPANGGGRGHGGRVRYRSRVVRTTAVEESISDIPSDVEDSGRLEPLLKASTP